MTDDTAYDRFEPRSVTWHGLHTIGGTTLKLYSVVYRQAPAPLPLSFDTVFPLVADALPAPDRAGGCPGMGFLILHQGATGDYAVLCWWDQQNELPTRVWVRKDGAWRAAGTRESFCVWDLEILWFERQAWVSHVLSGQPLSLGLEAYSRLRLPDADTPGGRWVSTSATV